jgi:CRP/FNR family transcriptional regulator
MIENIKYWYLRNHKLFEVLNDLEVKDLCIISNYKNAQKDEIIDFSGTDTQRLYIVKEGVVKICYQDDEGKEIITEILQDHDIFGCIHFSNTLQKTQRYEYAKALSKNTSLCSFEINRFKEVLEKNPCLMLKYTSFIGEKLISFQQKYSDIVFKDVETRLIDFFREYALKHGKERIDGSTEISMLLTHQEIAEYIASSRQSVTSAINKLEEEGKILCKSRKTVIIPNLKM